MDIQDVRRRRLAQLIDEKYGGVQARFIAETGQNQGEISALLKKKSFGEKKARKIEADCGLSAMWLDSPADSDVAKTATLSDGVLSNVEALDTEHKPVPLISWVQAGAWCEAIDPYNVGDAEDWISCPVKHSPRTYALRVRGESMFNPGGSPSFSNGDVIFVDPEREAIHRSLVIAKLTNSNEVTFKRLLIDGSARFLEALNPSWPNRIIEISAESHICGVVIARVESFV